MSKDTAKFVIGGREYNLGPLVIWSLDMCQKEMATLAKQDIPGPERAKTVLRIMVCGIAADLSMHPQITPEMFGKPVNDTELVNNLTDYFMRRLTYPESQELSSSIIKLMQISGFISETSEPPPGETEAATSTEIGPELSQNL